MEQITDTVKVKVVKRYDDKLLGKKIYEGEIIEVTFERAYQLEEANVARIIEGQFDDVVPEVPKEKNLTLSYTNGSFQVIFGLNVYGIGHTPEEAIEDFIVNWQNRYPKVEKVTEPKKSKPIKTQAKKKK